MTIYEAPDYVDEAFNADDANRIAQEAEERLQKKALEWATVHLVKVLDMARANAKEGKYALRIDFNATHTKFYKAALKVVLQERGFRVSFVHYTDGATSMEVRWSNAGVSK